jgi:hypothetical protein
MGTEAFTAMVPKMAATAAHHAQFPWGHFALFPWVTNFSTCVDGQVNPGPLVIGDAGCVGSDGTKYYTRHFPKRRESG